jgi:hypothetical protein
MHRKKYSHKPRDICNSESHVSIYLSFDGMFKSFGSSPCSVVSVVELFKRTIVELLTKDQVTQAHVM